jgi:cellulose synthase/poly-beta-1,6-N-acetylglucosamine synthase-like glycosyltransferase
VLELNPPQTIWVWSFFGLLMVILLVVMAFCLTEFALAINYIREKRRLAARDGEEPVPELARLPKVTLQLPIFNEKYVAERVIRSAAGINYPKDKLQIQVLDDSTDETVGISRDVVEELRADGLDISLCHRTDRNGFKAGALRDAMPACTGEFIAIFDADFIIPPDFLYDTLPYFNDEENGMVQTRWGHLNERYSILTRIQGFFIDLHFSVQHTGRNSAGYFINFNGTAGIWRKTCIQDAGGWTPDTLTEDLDLSYRAQLRGWKFKYKEGMSSPSELPAHMEGIKSQQFRWIKGGAQVGKKLFFPLAKSDANWKQKWFGYMHIFSGCTYIFSFVLFLLSVPLVYLFKYTFLNDFVPFMSIFLLSTLAIMFVAGVSFFNTQQDVQRKFTTFTWRFMMFLFFTMGLSLNNTIAIIEGFTGKKSDFIRTPKFNIYGAGTGQQWSNFAYISQSLRPQVIMEFLLLIYFVLGIVLGIYYGFYGLIALHIMLVIGYAMIVYYSVKHSFMMR